MNQVATVPQLQRLQLPTDATAMMQLADRLCMSRTIPSIFQKSAADCFNVLSVCMRFGFDFYSTIWECSNIKGRLFFSGKMVHAMLNASGFMAERLNFEYSGDLPNRQVIVRGRLVNETEPRIVTVVWSEVKTDNENWKKQPDQQLSYAGARIWGRRHCPEVLLGMLFEDEGPIIDVTPDKVPDTMDKRSPEEAKAAMHFLATGSQPKPKINVPPPPPDREEPYTLEPPDGSRNQADWTRWAQTFIAHVRASKTIAELDAWLDCNDDMIKNLRDLERDIHRKLANYVNEAREAVAEAEGEAGARSDT